MLKKVALTSLATIISIPAGIYIAHDFHRTYKAEKTKLPPQSILYVEHSGDYYTIGRSIKKLNEAEELKPTGTELDLLGIYYDDPRVILDESKHKAIFGFILNQSNRDVAIKLAQKDPKLKFVELPGLSVTGTKIPFMSIFSMLWALKKIQPDIRDQVKDQGLLDKETNIPILEIVAYKDNKPSTIGSYVPYGVGSEQLRFLKPQ